MGSLSILGWIVILLSMIYIGFGIVSLVRLSEAISGLRGVLGLETTIGQLEQVIAFGALTTATLFAAGALSGYLGIHSDRLQNEIDFLQKEIDELTWWIKQVGPPAKKDAHAKETQLRVSRPTETLQSPWQAEMEARRKAVEERRKRAERNDEETEKPEN